MKTVKFLSMMLVMLALSVSFVSCSDDNDDTPAIITISNNSTYTLNRFRVVFVTEKGEKLTDKEYGTLSQDDKITAEIPAGAAEYYMATYINTWFFSPNYPISITNNKLTSDVVNEWMTN